MLEKKEGEIERLGEGEGNKRVEREGETGRES